MKEIDFLPEWYKKARQRKMRYQAQYAVIICLLTAMIGWSFITAKSVSDAQALIQPQALSTAQEQALEECGQIQAKLSELGKQKSVFEKLDARLAVSDVLAEMSFLVDSKIILTQLDMQAEGFDNVGRSTSGAAGSVRVVKNVSSSQSLPSGDVRFKVVLQGMACETGDTARLIQNLEASPYFCQVIPEFSRNGKIKERDVSEFAIGCYIANYKGAK